MSFSFYSIVLSSHSGINTIAFFLQCTTHTGQTRVVEKVRQCILNVLFHFSSFEITLYVPCVSSLSTRKNVQLNLVWLDDARLRCSLFRCFSCYSHPLKAERSTSDHINVLLHCVRVSHSFAHTHTHSLPRFVMFVGSR